MIRVPTLITKPLIITVTGGLLTCLVYEVYQKQTNQLYEKPTLKGYTFNKELIKPNREEKTDYSSQREEIITDNESQQKIARSKVFIGKGKDPLVEDVLQIGWGIKERQRLQRQKKDEE